MKRGRPGGAGSDLLLNDLAVALPLTFGSEPEEELPAVETENGLITCQEPSMATATQEPAATATGTPPSDAAGASSLPDTGTGGGADAGLARPIIALVAAGLAMLGLSIAARGEKYTRP